MNVSCMHTRRSHRFIPAGRLYRWEKSVTSAILPAPLTDRQPTRSSQYWQSTYTHFPSDNLYMATADGVAPILVIGARFGLCVARDIDAARSDFVESTRQSRDLHHPAAVTEW
jgi:hypothetical protein